MVRGDVLDRRNDEENYYEEVSFVAAPPAGGPRRVLTFLTNPPVLRRILEHLGLPADPLPAVQPTPASGFVQPVLRAAEPSGYTGRTMNDRKTYWARNLRYVTALLIVWFTVSYLLGIVFVEPLNQWRLFGSGFKLGFWFAQQGSIYVFVVLIYIYVRLMNRLDKEFGVSEDE